MLFFSSISRKIMAGYVMVIGLFVLTTALIYQEANKIEQQKTEFIDRSLPNMALIDVVSSELQSLHLSAYEMYGTSLKPDAFAINMAKAESQITEQLNSLQADSGLVERSLFTKYRALLEQLTGLHGIMSVNSVDWDRARAQLEVVARHMDAFAGELSQLEQALREVAKGQSKAISEELNFLKLVILVVFAGVCLITLFAYAFSHKTIVLPIKKLASDLNHVAQSHDLTASINVHTRDEIHEAALAINDMLRGFHSTANSISNASIDLSKSAETLKGNAFEGDQLAVMFNRTVHELQQVIGDLEGHINQNSQQSAAAAETARVGADLVAQGTQSIERTAQSISSLATDIASSADALTLLKQDGDKVSGFVKSIAEIAEQTNLLALNAAIESARAGESGRGFAVVADEVRALAKRTHESTHEINQILDAIVQSITSTVDVMDVNRSKANESVDLARSTVESLNQIQQTVLQLSEINDRLAQVSQSTSQQSAVMLENTRTIADASDKISQNSKDVKDASNTVENMSQALQASISEFSL